ncbi:hypothetical protein BC936DRAFT_137248 [Jimgerdemannia flammicorona]|uniref:Uncharacterized protein n=1 Tax=Jimgerdemannia flammicorona TaxID=994334 RepID=A0A433CXS9_9FUNG|nr:hypothetical protein BC936DRAFT_137248 [Jimgerdemannia flammicorona]
MTELSHPHLLSLNYAPHDNMTLTPKESIFNKKTPTNNTARPEAATAEPKDPTETTTVAPARTNGLLNPMESFLRRTSFFLRNIFKRHSTGNTEGDGPIVPIVSDTFTNEPKEDGYAPTDRAGTRHKTLAWKNNRDDARESVAAREEEQKSNELKIRADAEKRRMTNSNHLSPCPMPLT